MPSGRLGREHFFWAAQKFRDAIFSTPVRVINSKTTHSLPFFFFFGDGPFLDSNFGLGENSASSCTRETANVF